MVREGVELEMPRRLSVTIVSLTLHISLVCGLHRSIDFTADCREDAELSRGIDVTTIAACFVFFLILCVLCCSSALSNIKQTNKQYLEFERLKLSNNHELLP